MKNLKMQLSKNVLDGIVALSLCNRQIQLETNVQKKRFIIDFNGNGYKITPSTGLARDVSEASINKFIKLYNTYKTYETSIYKEIFDSSYLLALVKIVSEEKLIRKIGYGTYTSKTSDYSHLDGNAVIAFEIISNGKIIYLFNSIIEELAKMSMQRREVHSRIITEKFAGKFPNINTYEPYYIEATLRYHDLYRDVESIIRKLDNKNDDLYISDLESFPEGKLVAYRHFKRERNARLVAEKKKDYKSKHGKVNCEACGFDFESVYGKIGENYIEAHHLVPISSSMEERESTINDLMLLCSNCHRMVHKIYPWVDTIELVKCRLTNDEPNPAVIS